MKKKSEVINKETPSLEALTQMQGLNVLVGVATHAIAHGLFTEKEQDMIRMAILSFSSNNKHNGPKKS